jgi:hypothetical protein
MRVRFIVGIIFILLGFSALTGIDLWRFIFPFILIYIGWRILVRGQENVQEEDKIESSSQSSIDETFIFSGTQRRLDSENFNGGKIVAVFGGADLDLSGAKAKKKIIEMELVAVFGGVKLRIPANWEVVSEAVGILGGIDNKTSVEQKSATLRISGAAVFGGVEILN